MLRGPAKLMALFTVVYFVVMIGAVVGVVPAILVPFAPFVMLFGYGIIEILYVKTKYAGKHFVDVKIRISDTETKRIVHMIEEISPAKGSGNIYKLKLVNEGGKLPFLGFESPYSGVILRFPENISFYEIFDEGVIYPEEFDIEIPVYFADVDGVLVSFYHDTKTVENPRWKQLLLRKPALEHVPLLFPVVLVVNYKKREMQFLDKVKDIVANAGFPTAQEAEKILSPIWVDELKNLHIVDSEKMRLSKKVIELSKRVDELENILAAKPVPIQMLKTEIVSEERIGSPFKRVELWVLGVIVVLLFILLLMRLAG